mgnify:CR=1 FL=1
MANERMEIDVVANDLASANLKKTRDGIEKVGQQAKVTAAQTRSLTGSLGGVGRSAGQAGIQVQQFVGQIQGGVNPMVALSQQGADLGFVLGVPLLGAVVGIGASLVSILIPSLMDSADAARDLKKELKELVPDLESLSLDELRLSVDLLSNAISEQKAELIKNQAEIDKQNRIIDEATRAIATGKDNIIAEEKARAKARKELKRLNGERLLELRKLEELRTELGQVGNVIETGYTSKIFDAKKALQEARFETDKFIRTNANMFGIFRTSFAKDTDPVQDITAMWQETDKYTVSTQTLGEEIKKTAMTMTDVGRAGLNKLEDSLVDFALGAKSAKDAFKDMARSIIADLIRMSIQQRITAPIFNAMFGQSPTQYTTVRGSSAPTVGAPEAYFEGGGFTGYGARAGGVDGRGGFPAILHPNETVIDHTKGQSMGGGVTVNLNISTGVSQTVRSEIANLLPQITQATKAAVADARMRGGSFSKSMVGA